MNPLGSLVRLTINNPDTIDAILRSREEIADSIKYLAFAEFMNAVYTLLRFTEEHNKCPDSFATLRHFVQFSESKPIIACRENIYAELEALETSDEELVTDPLVLINEIWDLGDKAFYAEGFRTAADITAGHQDYPEKSFNTGVEAAKEFLFDRATKHKSRQPSSVSGDIRENATYLGLHLDSYMTNHDSGRILTGFEAIDAYALIGKKLDVRWIGIMGFTNHCKSLVLHSMVFNMAKDGHNVLLVPREDSVDNTYCKLAWMLQAAKYPERPFVSLAGWKRSAGHIGWDSALTKDRLIKDLKQGETFKGRLDVQGFDTWDEITEYMKATNHKHPVDVLAIDYITHLRVEGRDAVQEMKTVLRKAQMLTQNGINNDKSGLVIITPLQVNKKAYEEIDKKEGEGWGVYEDATGIDYYTQAAQDMDMVIGVWHKDFLKNTAPQGIIVSCAKLRGAEVKFPTHTVCIDSTTGYVSSKAPAPQLDDSFGGRENLQEALHTTKWEDMRFDG